MGKFRSKFYELIDSFRITGLGSDVSHYRNQTLNYQNEFTPILGIDLDVHGKFTIK